MIWLAVLLAWYAIGALGSFLVLYFGFARDGMNVHASDCAFWAALALFGPLAFIVGIFWMAGHFFIRITRDWGDPVVFRARH